MDGALEACWFLLSMRTIIQTFVGIGQKFFTFTAQHNFPSTNLFFCANLPRNEAQVIMAEAEINETCIIGLPTCGYAFSSSRMAFIATPSDDEFSLEVDVLETLLADKDYESFVALEVIDPAKLAFCTKICSKIITSQFCIVLLNSSKHREHPAVMIPNP